ncbi:hypothetical protein [Allostreptomyces psammosilenae]|uniref:Uncharacterized protein n=1 Tax=Allostreptomyces psammosilenae TaxID=1892865 RepID=A0A852ZNP7_9ACTN|nr:hypothetical protein [Allostreptomyces psammosilenae]NYI03305.1 hypothetical protein [Allostreptomyces psammosilenae]
MTSRNLRNRDARPFSLVRPTAPGTPSGEPVGPTAAPEQQPAPLRTRYVRPRIRRRTATDQLAERVRRRLDDEVSIARWARPSVPVTERGDLPLREARRAERELDLPAGAAEVWRRARIAGLVEAHDGTARAAWRTTAWDRDPQAVLRAWSALFESWRALAEDHLEPGPLADELERHAPQLLAVLHLEAGPASVAGLLHLLHRCVEEQRPLGPDEHRRLPGLLDAFLDTLADIGAVQRSSHACPEGPSACPHCASDWLRCQWCATADRARLVELSSLGNWAVQAKLEEICAVAQTEGGHIEQSAVEMLTACVAYSPGPARAEYRAWLAARPVDRAVDELLAAAGGDSPLLRAMAFDALRMVGAPAVPGVRAAAAAGGVLRPHALLWLMSADGDDPDPAALDEADATVLWVDTAAALVDHADPHLLLAHLEQAPIAGPHDLFRAVAAGPHPRAAEVLAAIAAVHPDPAAARSARKAAWRTS